MRQSVSNTSNISKIYASVTSDDLQPHNKFTEVVFIEGQDIDAEFEGSMNVPPDVESSSESVSEQESEEGPEAMFTSTKFEKGHTQNRGAVGKSWEDRKPPSELQALEALDEIKSLLRPEKERKSQKWYKASTVRGWSSNILKKIQSFLNLFTGEKSATKKGQWIKASEQATQSLGQVSKNAQNSAKLCKEIYCYENASYQPLWHLDSCPHRH